VFAIYDYLWSYVVMKQIGIADLKSRLSEFLRLVQGGESITVMDRNREIAQIVPVVERPGIRIRKPVPNSPKPNKVPIPKAPRHNVDVLDLLLEERQNNR
jgi:prevent-host-death family protein